ncbi:ribonuclease III [bacterium]
MNSIKEFEKANQLIFQNIELLKKALTHKSYAIEQGISFDNERLEFLGDTILSLIVSEYLFNKFKDAPEGTLTKIRAKIVSKSNLILWAESIELGKYLYLGRGEELTKGRIKASNLANAFEALIAAVFLDQGMDEVKQFILKFLELIDIENLEQDYKSLLQEIIQKKYKQIPIYKILSEKGPAHDKLFKINVMVQEEILGQGQGKSKKKAETNAAKNALDEMIKNNL